jgi:hypothetical protein
MALFGERSSWRPSHRYSPEQLKQRMGRLRANLIVVGAPGSDFATRFPAAAVLEARTREPGAEVIYRNRSFVVFQLRASG